MKRFIYLLFCICLFSCETGETGKKVEVEKANTATDKRNYDVVKLFTVDGITIYRFYDAGYYRYFTSTGQFVESPYAESNDEDTNEILLMSTVN